mgnify:FL=1
MNNENAEFLCWFMGCYFGLSTIWMERNLIELYEKRHNDYVWFSKIGDCSLRTNRKLRIEVINQCILETHPDNN